MPKPTGLFRLLDICEKAWMSRTVALSGNCCSNPKLLTRALGRTHFAHKLEPRTCSCLFKPEEEDAEIQALHWTPQSACGASARWLWLPRGALARSRLTVNAMLFTDARDFLDAGRSHDVETQAGPLSQSPYNMGRSLILTRSMCAMQRAQHSSSKPERCPGWMGFLGAPHYCCWISVPIRMFWTAPTVRFPIFYGKRWKLAIKP